MLKTQSLPGGFIRTYSDKSLKIQQIGTGIEYDEAVDPVGSGRKYAETNIPVAVSNVD